MKTKNVVFAGLSALSMTLSPIASSVAPLGAPVYAKSVAPATMATPNGVADFGEGNASITIKGNSGQTLVGKKFNVYKLFDAENAVDQESINYTWNDAYKTALQNVVGKKINKSASAVSEYDVIDYINSLNTNKVEGAQADQKLEGRYSNYRKFVEALRDEMVKENLAPTSVSVTATRPDGSVKFGGLGYGYYLTDEVTAVQGTNSAASLILTNTANPDATVQIKSDYPTITKKIAEDDNAIGWNDIGDYEIGQKVPYYFDNYVPNMNGYSAYKVVFHDKMDSALTFNKDSFSITISSAKKSYTLKSSEFNIVQNSGDDTFYAEIPDLKGIVDKQFPEGMNNLHENEYGQNIHVTYNATLNDKAAEKTGRPGFENAVRFEFANDPDSNGNGSTGETPWDTTVAFTYRINGLKVNNHNKLLKNAKFRLYSDSACQNEVYVKSSPNGYVVVNRDSVGGTDHTGGTRPSSAVEMSSDEKGVFNILGLDQGTYYLKETDSPAGYRELLDPIVINIKPTFTDERNNYNAGEGATDKTLKTLEATAHVKEFLNGAYKESDTTLTTDVAKGSANITVVNYVGTKLPITGSSLTMICLGAGTITVVGALVLDKKRKNKNKD